MYIYLELLREEKTPQYTALVGLLPALPTARVVKKIKIKEKPLNKISQQTYLPALLAH